MITSQVACDGSGVKVNSEPMWWLICCSLSGVSSTSSTCRLIVDILLSVIGWRIKRAKRNMWTTRKHRTARCLYSIYLFYKYASITKRATCICRTFCISCSYFPNRSISLIARPPRRTSVSRFLRCFFISVSSSLRTLSIAFSKLSSVASARNIRPSR